MGYSKGFQSLPCRIIWWTTSEGVRSTRPPVAFLLVLGKLKKPSRSSSNWLSAKLWWVHKKLVQWCVQRNISTDPDEVFRMYNQGTNLVDPSAKQAAEYFIRLVSWYTGGEFSDELGIFHNTSICHSGRCSTRSIASCPPKSTLLRRHHYHPRSQPKHSIHRSRSHLANYYISLEYVLQRVQSRWGYLYRSDADPFWMRFSAFSNSFIPILRPYCWNVARPCNSAHLLNVSKWLCCWAVLRWPLLIWEVDWEPWKTRSLWWIVFDMLDNWHVQ